MTVRSNLGEWTNSPLALVARIRTNELEGGNKAEQVADQLETAIAVGLISEGQRLPPERDLATQLGVTMLNLRQALALLRDRALIETRRGRGGGSIVRETSVVSDHEAERRLRENSTEGLRDLGDLAGSIDATAARLAAARADEPDLVRLHALADALETADGAAQLRRADSRLHIELAVAAQSKRLATAAVQIQGELAPLLWSRQGSRRNMATVVEAHKSLIEAIAAGEQERAQSAAIAHAEQESGTLIDAHLNLVLTAGA